MRYFTREWYQSIQDAPRPSQGTTPGENEPLSAAELACQATGRYGFYLSSVAPRLTENVAILVCLHLHDARVIKAVRFDTSVTLVLRDMFTRKRYSREITIEFSGCNKVVGIENVEGQDIIYDEVEVKEDGRFEYCALLDKTEFAVHFETVHIQVRDISS
jgi:hypothetical protein